jgi:hypothetical protein
VLGPVTTVASINHQEASVNLSQRPRRTVRRSVGLTAASAMVLAIMPAGVAAAQEGDSPEPRDTDRVCSGEYESSFDDVDGNVHEDAILCAADYGIAAGYGDDTFRPGNLVQRDQMASFIARWVEDATGEELPEGDQGFADVDPENVHRESINKLTNAEIARGFDEDTYGPDRRIDRDQMASFIARALSYIDDEDAANASEPPVADQAYFSDVDEDNVHSAAIDALAEQGIVAGYQGTDEYGPDDDVRRDQMTSFIMRGYDYAVEAGLVQTDVSAAVSIISPTTDAPDTVEQGGELDVVFDTSVQCDYSLDILPSTATDDEWMVLDQGVTDEGEETVTVTIDDEAELGTWDLRATCATEEEADSTIEEEAIEVVAGEDG